MQPRRRILRGRVVTVDARFTVHPRGLLCLEDARIAAVLPDGAPVPAAFAGVKPIDTRALLYPGLIDLHNHLAYDVLRLWAVPRRFGDRDQWAAAPSYHRDVTGPMSVLGQSPELLPAVARYVECKCLLGGTTTTQGLALFSNAGARRYYRGLVRNAEDSGADDLPDALARIADVDARDATRFRARLAKASCLLLHLAEGTNATARSHFLALHTKGGWAVGPALAAIHATALERADFDILAKAGASIVWSPLSNLLLYGATTRIDLARAAGVRIALGPDWSYSGSKNLLGELKVARLASAAAGAALSDRDLVAAATRDAAAVLKWDAALGTLEPGKRADVVAIADPGGDPHAALFAATEADVELVLIDGEPRYGTPGLMTAMGATQVERLRVAGRARDVALRDDAADPAVRALTLAEAKDRLHEALGDLPALAERLAKRSEIKKAMRWLTHPAEAKPTWFLALDEIHPSGLELRPMLDVRSPAPRRPAASTEALQALELDPLTAIDDAELAEVLHSQANLPLAIEKGVQRSARNTRAGHRTTTRRTPRIAARVR